MTVTWPTQSESGTDDDEARDGEPNRAWMMVCESMKRSLTSSNGSNKKRPGEGLTMTCESRERRFNSSEHISDYFEDPDSNDEIAEDVNNENLEVVGAGDEEEEQVMRLRGGALPELHNESGLNENDMAAVENLQEKYPAQDVSEEGGQSEGSGQNSTKRRKIGSGRQKGKVQRNGESRPKRKRDSRRRKNQSNGNKKSEDDQLRDDNDQKASSGKSVENRQISSSGHKESNGNSAGYGQIRSNEQVEENIQGEDPIEQMVVDRMWNENAGQNQARACRLSQKCEDQFACWCEGMQEIEDSNLW
jgi:hypothetical protein